MVKFTFKLSSLFNILLDFRKQLQGLKDEDARKFLSQGNKLTVNGHELTSEFLSVKLVLKKEALPENLELGGEGEIKVLLDLSQDEGMKKKGTAREVVNRIQRLRKSSGLNPDDDVIIFLHLNDDAKNIKSAYEANKKLMEGILRKPFHLAASKPEHFEVIAKESFSHENENFDIVICKNHLTYNQQSIEVCIEE